MGGGAAGCCACSPLTMVSEAAIVRARAAPDRVAVAANRDFMSDHLSGMRLRIFYTIRPPSALPLSIRQAGTMRRAARTLAIAAITTTLFTIPARAPAQQISPEQRDAIKALRKEIDQMNQLLNQLL